MRGWCVKVVAQSGNGETIMKSKHYILSGSDIPHYLTDIETEEVSLNREDALVWYSIEEALAVEYKLSKDFVCGGWGSQVISCRLEEIDNG